MLKQKQRDSRSHASEHSSAHHVSRRLRAIERTARPSFVTRSKRSHASKRVQAFTIERESQYFYVADGRCERNDVGCFARDTTLSMVSVSCFAPACRLTLHPSASCKRGCHGRDALHAVQLHIHQQTIRVAAIAVMSNMSWTSTAIRKL